jgi:hypothetical protein
MYREFKKGDRVMFDDVEGIGTPYENATGTVLRRVQGNMLKVCFDDSSLHNYDGDYCTMYSRRFKVIGFDKLWKKI